ncbi:hypothetical protein SANTM175S_07609 [Streptomyces antimycoticus]
MRWIEEPKEGAAKPENPAPVLELVGPGSDGHDAPQRSPGKDGGSGKASARTPASADSSDDKDGGLGIVIVIGAARLRRGREPPPLRLTADHPTPAHAGTAGDRRS